MSEKDEDNAEESGDDSPESDDELDLSDDEDNETDSIQEEIQLRAVKFDDVKNTLGRDNINNKTLKSYITAFNAFVNKVRALPTERNGKADDKIEQYISEQFESNPEAGNLTKMNNLVCMIKILHPRIYASITNSKATLKNWTHTTKPQ